MKAKNEMKNESEKWNEKLSENLMKRLKWKLKWKLGEKTPWRPTYYLQCFQFNFFHWVFTTVFTLVLGTYRRRGPSKDSQALAGARLPEKGAGVSITREQTTHHTDAQSTERQESTFQKQTEPARPPGKKKGPRHEEHWPHACIRTDAHQKKDPPKGAFPVFLSRYFSFF